MFDHCWFNNSMACRVSCARCSGVLQGNEVTKVLVEAALDGLAAQCLICPALHMQQLDHMICMFTALLCADYRAVRSTEHCMNFGHQTPLTSGCYREVPAAISDTQLLLLMQLLSVWTYCSLKRGKGILRRTHAPHVVDAPGHIHLLGLLDGFARVL